MIKRYIVSNFNKRYYITTTSTINNSNSHNIKYSKNHTWVSIPNKLDNNNNNNNSSGNSNNKNSFEIQIPGEEEEDSDSGSSGSNGNETIVTFGLTNEFINLNTKYDDILYIKFPLIGSDSIIINKECITIETMSDYFKINSPLSGKVIKVNQNLLDYPNDLNQDPYKHWLAKLSIQNNTELNQLMNKEDYIKYCNRGTQ